MQKITKNEAIQAAKTHVDLLAIKAGDCFELLLDETIELDRGWIFFYNSCEYVSSRNDIDSLAGNGPLFVSNDLIVYDLPSSISWEKALENLIGT